MELYRHTRAQACDVFAQHLGPYGECRPAPVPTAEASIRFEDHSRRRVLVVGKSLIAVKATTPAVAGGILNSATRILFFHMLMQLMLTLRQSVSDRAVLEAMEMTPREVFVEGAFRERAFEDRALPIPGSRT